MSVSPPPLGLVPPSRPPLIQLEGTVIRVRHHQPHDGWTLLDLRARQGHPVVAVGHFPSPLDAGQSLHLLGEWTTHPRHGQQFKVSGITHPGLVDHHGLERFLMSGTIKGIGPVLASKLIDLFGMETLSILNDTPERLLEIPGIRHRKLKQIQTSWDAHRTEAFALAQLCGLGLTITQATRVIKRFGSHARPTIQDNPYRLTEVRGIGFPTADHIARGLGVAPTAPIRLRAALLYVTDQHTRDGHCYITPAQLLMRSFKEIQQPNAILLPFIDELIRSGDLIQEDQRLYLPQIHRAERGLEQDLTELASGPGSLRAITLHHDELHYTEEQAQAIQLGLTQPLAIITGGPGTGKTTIIREVVRQMAARGQALALCAPTGKAAKRLQETTNAPASTVHRLLNWGQDGPQYHAEEPLPHDLVILDEASMCDVFLLRALTRAIQPARTRLLLVGDADQLPSVGPGHVFRDLIRAQRCPIIRLTHIHRQAAGSQIIQLAHAVNQGTLPTWWPHPAQDVTFCPITTIEEAQDALRTTFHALQTHHGFRPQEIQVLVPQKTGKLGTPDLNLLIQSLVNPTPRPSIGRLKLGDRVIHLANDYQRMVFNGEVGTIVECHPHIPTLLVDFGDKHIEYGRGEFDDLDLAYALTIHKSQGSEFPAVILLMHSSAPFMQRRGVLYTGITRAKAHLTLIGPPASFAHAVRNHSDESRATSLFRRPSLSGAPSSAAPLVTQ